MSKPPAKKSAPAKSKPAPAPVAMPDEMKWQAKDALHTLKRAHEIKNDPKLMHHVREHAKSERAAITKVIGRGGKS
jgi:hypothetical protein